MNKELKIYILFFFLIIGCGYPTSKKQQLLQDVNGTHRLPQIKYGYHTNIF